MFMGMSAAIAAEHAKTSAQYPATPLYLDPVI
jgi:hypothetical protein